MGNLCSLPSKNQPLFSGVLFRFQPILYLDGLINNTDYIRTVNEVIEIIKLIFGIYRLNINSLNIYSNRVLINDNSHETIREIIDYDPTGQCIQNQNAESQIVFFVFGSQNIYALIGKTLLNSRRVKNSCSHIITCMEIARIKYKQARFHTFQDHLCIRHTYSNVPKVGVALPISDTLEDNSQLSTFNVIADTDITGELSTSVTNNQVSLYSMNVQTMSIYIKIYKMYNRSPYNRHCDPLTCIDVYESI
jgi:hypothetical protein